MGATTGPGVPHGAPLPVHPRTGLTAVGIVGGRPVWPIRGGAPEPGEPGEPSGTTPPADPPPAQQQPGQAPQQQPAKTDLASLPADVQKLIEGLRGEAAKNRTEKQTAAQAAAEAQAQKAAVLKALGLKDDGTEDLDPSKLTEQIDQAKAIAWETGVENNVIRLASKLGLDSDALLDSTSFLDSLVDFVEDDPRSADFRTKFEEHLKQFGDKHPKFKAATKVTPARSGGSMTPGSGGGIGGRSTSLSAAVSKALSG